MSLVLKRCCLIVISSLSLAATACGGASGPCSGGGMEKDLRELPADWAALNTIPPGAIACHGKPEENVPSTDSKYMRRYEVGSNQRDGYEIWRRELVAAGWKIDESRDGKSYKINASKDGHGLSLFVSGAVEKFAWSTIEFSPKLQKE